MVVRHHGHRTSQGRTTPLRSSSHEGSYFRNLCNHLSKEAASVMDFGLLLRGYVPFSFKVLFLITKNNPPQLNGGNFSRVRKTFVATVSASQRGVRQSVCPSLLCLSTNKQSRFSRFIVLEWSELDDNPGKDERPPLVTSYGRAFPLPLYRHSKNSWRSAWTKKLRIAPQPKICSIITSSAGTVSLFPCI